MTRGSHYWPATALLLLCCCVVFRSQSRCETAEPPSVVEGIVFAIDGAGGFEAASRTIRQTAAEANLPFEVRGFHWTHGYCRVLSDQIHAKHLRHEGYKLSQLILTCRMHAPQRPIFLIGHSAGCGVILIAAEHLPPDTLERIVLLSPAVSSKHDLRPALCSSRLGIDVFYSSHDWACLGIGTLLAGTTDRSWSLAAGKVGFHPIVHGPEDEGLYDKLRQYPWNASLNWTGNKGGHYGAYQPKFLRTFVFPLLLQRETQ